MTNPEIRVEGPEIRVSKEGQVFLLLPAPRDAKPPKNLHTLQWRMTPETAEGLAHDLLEASKVARSQSG